MRKNNSSLAMVFVLILFAALIYSNDSSLRAADDPPPPPPVPGFKIDGKQPFRFVGGFIPTWHWDQSAVTDDNLMQTARAFGITVLVAMVPDFEKALGYYSEPELVKLDHFLDSAREQNIYVMISFIHSDDTLQPDSPYYHPRGIEGLIKNSTLRQAFRKRIAALVNRKNTLNGRLYKNDPTLMGWILCMEPISSQDYPNGLPRVTLEQMTDWFRETASDVKRVDSNHLVTVQIQPAFQSFFGGGGEFLTAVSIPHFDFVYAEDPDQRIIMNAPDNDFCLRLFNAAKPVVFSPAFTGDTWNQTAICKDYEFQGDYLEQSTVAYFEAGASGVVIQSLASDIGEIPSSDQCYTYIHGNTVIRQYLTSFSTWINPDGLPGTLQFLLPRYRLPSSTPPVHMLLLE